MKKRKTVERFPNGHVGAEQPALLGVDRGWEREWRGLPEFEQLRREPYALINVRLATAGDLAEFSKLVGQRLQRTTKSIWYPALLRGIDSGKWYERDARDNEVQVLSAVLQDVRVQAAPLQSAQDVVSADDRSDAARDAAAGEAGGGYIKRPKKQIGGQLSMFKDGE